MNLIVFSKSNPNIPLGRFGLYVHARTFAAAAKASGYTNLVIFDTERWEVIPSKDSSEGPAFIEGDRA